MSVVSILSRKWGTIPSWGSVQQTMLHTYGQQTIQDMSDGVEQHLVQHHNTPEASGVFLPTTGGTQHKLDLAWLNTLALTNRCSRNNEQPTRTNTPHLQHPFTTCFAFTTV